jgi:sugar O-acyltransferase (sialic acid O-acetyltransferase NeuD family)
MKDLVIVGTGGFSKEIICLAKDCGRNVIGLLGDVNECGEKILNIPVLGKLSEYSIPNNCEIIVAVGSSEIRRKIVSEIKCIGEYYFATLIHPSAKMSEFVGVGEGSIVCAGCVLTADIKIGSHSILNLNTTIGHDVEIGDYVTIAPQVAVSGCVHIAAGVEVGTGSSIRQGLKLGARAILGMGSVLTKDIPEDTVFVGNPAKLHVARKL